LTINFKELAVEWYQLYGGGISRELLDWLHKVEAYRYDLGVSTMSYTERGVCNFRLRMSVPEIHRHMFDVINNPNHRDVTDLSKEEFNRVMNLMGYRRDGG
jgi:mitochondrial fission protein ELM1